jgi:hypothetical protein
MLGGQAESNDRDIRLLPRRLRSDFLHVDLAGDHVMAQPDDDLGEDVEPLALLVCDQDAQMLGIDRRHRRLRSGGWFVTAIRSALASGSRDRVAPVSMVHVRDLEVVCLGRVNELGAERPHCFVVE